MEELNEAQVVELVRERERERHGLVPELYLYNFMLRVILCIYYVIYDIMSDFPKLK